MNFIFETVIGIPPVQMLPNAITNHSSSGSLASPLCSLLGKPASLHAAAGKCPKGTWRVSPATTLCDRRSIFVIDGPINGDWFQVHVVRVASKHR
jgi:hypothetical protein